MQHSRMILLNNALLLLVLTLNSSKSVAQIIVQDHPHDSSVQLSAASEIVYEKSAPMLIGIAANDLAGDIGRVSGSPAKAVSASKATTQIWIGVLGQDPRIDSLVNKGSIDGNRLHNCWECFDISVLRNPLPGINAVLVIAGSDRRGAAYGAYEISRAIGVSPWYWWADVSPLHRKAIHLSIPTPVFSQPTVKYRGIYINDEDWGIFRWAKNTYDPETGNFGPKTYEKVFQLLLRLKANTLWPAMHQVSAPFNSNPRNAQLADLYGIIMSASHSEPMLRNNVGEWKEDHNLYNFITNHEDVMQYWEQRVASNGKYENIYPVGMRGIHDSPMIGVKTIPEKQNALNRVIFDQRALLDKHVAPAATVPQIFVPYKEVLQVYKAGIELPSDITLVWPDDNFGYIRHFADTVEGNRSGRSGVYYHLSYLGAPLSYLWLCTTPPALISEEMTRAYDHGADRFWIFNVGDIKPAEIDISFAMDLAWDTKTLRTVSQKEYLTQFAAQSFGPDHAAEIGEILDLYYKLNFERRPEHLQYYLPKETPRDSGLSAASVFARIASIDDLLKKLDAVTARMPKVQTESFYELVEYPVRSSALANQRFFDIEAYDHESAKNANLGGFYAGRARKEDAAIKQLTARYNNKKWRDIMSEEPADQEWKSFRLAAPVLPPATSVRGDNPPVTPAPVDEVVHVEAESVRASGWQMIAGLGRGAGSMRASTPNAPLTTNVAVPHEGSWCLNTYILPTFPTDNSTTWELNVVVDDNKAQTLKYTHEPTSPQWSQGVLDNRLAQSFPVMLPAGVHKVSILSPQPDLILDGYDLTLQVDGGCH